MSKLKKSNLYKNLFPYLKPHLLRLIVVFLALAIVASSILLLGQGLKYIIDIGLTSHSASSINKVFLILLGLIIILSLGSFFRSSNINLICEKIELQIKKDIFAHIISLSPEFYESNKTSDVISRLTNDLSVINSIISTTISFALRNFIMLVGGLIFLFITNFKLSGYVIMVTPLAILPIIILGKKIKSYSRKNQDMVGILSAKIEESINNIKIIQAFCHEKHDAASFSKIVDDIYSFSKKRILLRAFMAALVIFVVLASISFVLWIGGMDVIKGRMTAGDLSSFLYYSIMVATSAAGLSDVFGDLQRAKASAERVVELLEYRSQIQGGKHKNPKLTNLNIKFDNVTFYYPTREDKAALQNFTLEIKQGEALALVGKSGAGKSTIFELLLRFFDLSNGSITIDNLNIRDFKLQDLRAIFAIVPQDPVIFSLTALENIRFGREDASYEEVVAAAKIAEIYDFIMSLPEGFYTYLGEKGVRISGGQKQRLAIARAVLRDPKILLLDEATSSLDTTNEQLVLKALDKVSKGRTTISIAHRISTIKRADRIILLDNAKIIDIGTHNELYQRGGLYKELWDAQSDAEKDVS